MERSLSEKLEYAILETVMGPNATEGTHQDFFGDWEARARNHLPDQFTTGDLKDAFKRLRRKDVLYLSKGYPAQS